MERVTLGPNIKSHAARLSAQVYVGDFQKMFVVAAISAAVVLFSGVIMFNSNRPAESARHGNSTPVALADTNGTSTAPLVLGVNIANNGLAYIRGAKVTRVEGNVIETEISWGSAQFVWKVQTTATTKFFGLNGQKQTILDIKNGDILDVTGAISSVDGKLVIAAEYVRE